MTSWANGRSIAYFTSFDVTVVPSWYFTPLRSVYFQVFPPSVGTACSVARSPTSRTAPGCASKLSSGRKMNRMKSQSPNTYVRAGSSDCQFEWNTSCRVPPTASDG